MLMRRRARSGPHTRGRTRCLGRKPPKEVTMTGFVNPSAWSSGRGQPSTGGGALLIAAIHRVWTSGDENGKPGSVRLVRKRKTQQTLAIKMFYKNNQISYSNTYRRHFQRKITNEKIWHCSSFLRAIIRLRRWLLSSGAITNSAESSPRNERVGESPATILRALPKSEKIQIRKHAGQ